MDLNDLIKNYVFCKGIVTSSGNQMKISIKDSDPKKNFEVDDEVLIIKIPKKVQS